MKKLVLSILALSLSAGGFAQNRSTRIKVTHNKTVTNANGETQLKSGPSIMNTTIPVRKGGLTPRTAAITVTDIGHSPNHLTVGFGAKTALFAHPGVNSVVMVFRNAPAVANTAGSSGYYNYGLSTDGGATWAADQFPLYDATGGAATPFANGRYPQGLIYNPIGNTTPSNAYIAFVGAGLAGTNGAWGGIPNGALSMAPASTPYQSEILSDRTQVPNTFMIAPTTNNSYVLDPAVDAVVSLDYVDSMALYIGTWNSTNNAYDYAYNPVYAPVGLTGAGSKDIWEGRIAFAPNSNTGYMSILGHPDYALYPDSVIVPMIYKTMDGGITWTYLGAIDLAGVNGVLPTAVDYSTYTDHDLIVDANGNAHIVSVISRGNNDGTISIAYGEWGIFDIYCTGGGTNWFAQLLDLPQSFEYIWASADNATPENNRAQASSTWAGDKVFFSWFDTDTLTFGTSENAFPDMHVRAYDINSGMWTSASNLTAGSLADGSCSFGNVSPYVFSASGVHTIPMTFQFLVDPTIGLATTTHKYVGGLEVADAAFTVTGAPSPLTIITGIKESQNAAVKSVKVYPNPATGRSNTLVFTTEKSSNITVELVNMIGQVSKTVDYGMLNAGEQKLNLDVEGLEAGIYVVKVKAGDNVAVSKITVK